MSDDLKRKAAEAAMSEVKSGMRIGLGTGSTAKHFVDLLGAEVAKGFQCLCVPTSEATAAQARGLGIPLTTLDDIDSLDVTVDGADEIDRDFQLIKGGGGALLREKIVAAASARMIVIADDSKLVESLGRFALPIEVNPFGLAATERAIAGVMAEFGALGGKAVRQGEGAEPYLTDGGHYIVDASFGRISNAKALSLALLEIPGVVQHGLFIDLCSEAYLATPKGTIKLSEHVNYNPLIS
ncbi:ribose-5-phosphate isomerase [Pelagibacterium halotolerans]|uniref:Ribose-5-phosphate isomerase A n=1 Tax=Pelagibacterium halotolerans (strain DSM 22347 / JCM 15775 / CGMCC 1.7692 / B2) TaxID=1082931 RepID=G4RF46_PELHB|nr:ribose 5-phosphate isomerase A [Pelagibacterium halotolerans B2]SDZ99803.1 ribose-5-phosphate isomerase [Pelagibacterium halotolerans]